MEQIPKLFQDFLEFNARDVEKQSSLASITAIMDDGKKQAFETFHFAAEHVPAYKDFLKKNNVDSEKITKFEDFEKVPLTNKKNYLSKYPISQLLTNGSFNEMAAVTSSSGSSGTPFYWPRFPVQDFGAAKGFDLFLTNTFDLDKKRTLHVNCSGMGVWTAGDYISLLLKYLSYKYPNNTSVSPGIDMDTTVNLLKNLSPDFEQTIIYSYPPFVKDIVDNLPRKLIKKCNFKLVVYGEPYTESWRAYMLKKIGSDFTTPHHISSVLGSAEGGLIGSETISCTVARVIAQKNRNIRIPLFNEPRVPSLIQYNPLAKYIEIVDSNIVLTNMGGLPLIRYDTRDYGSIITKEEISNILKEHLNIDFTKETTKYKGIVTSMPYLYVFGRSDYTASIYGVLIYPETVKDILATTPFSKFLSGRFVMSTDEDQKSNQFLNIKCEARINVSRKDIDIINIEKTFAYLLRKYSSEYKKLLSSMGKKVYPKIKILNYGHPEYFSSKNKQKYIM